ncbi:RICIN domain-containing protein [Kribbella deserti]|uniref:RICIN domain-containing protein n=1 Tax=Kribbella deserti TaxID=1926257 RepID=A0ABV6QQ34_9ACTN
MKRIHQRAIRYPCHLGKNQRFLWRSDQRGSYWVSELSPHPETNQRVLEIDDYGNSQFIQLPISDGGAHQRWNVYPVESAVKR